MNEINDRRKKYSLTDGPVLSALLKLSFPIMLAGALQSAYQFIDTFWVGRLGGKALAAVSVGFPLFTLLIALGTGLAVAGSVLVAQYFGAGNQRMVNHVSAQTLLLVITTSLVFSVIGYFATPHIFKLMRIGEEIFSVAVSFFRVSLMGLVFAFSFSMFQSVMRDVGEVKLPMYVVLGTVILDFFLDPLFIFGWGPVPALGAVGAAYATLATQCLAAIAGFYFLFGGKFGIHIKMRDFIPNFGFIKRVFFLGLPASVEQSVRALSGAVLMFMIARFGTVAIAAYGVGTNVVDLVLIPATGLSLATSTLVAQSIGAGKEERAARTARLSALISFLSFSAIGILSFLLAYPIVKFFIPSDPVSADAGAAFIKIVSFSFGFAGIHLALGGVFRASGRFFLALILSVISQWVIQLPLALLLSRFAGLGSSGIWMSYPLTSFAMALITAVLFAKGVWRGRRLTDDEKFNEKVSEEIIAEEGIR